MFLIAESRLLSRNQFIDDFLKSKVGSALTTKRHLKCDSTRLSVIKALENMAKTGMQMHGFIEEQEDDVDKRRQCFGRELCLRMVEEQNDRKWNQKPNNTFDRVVNEFETLFLMYHQTSDYSIAFTNFLDDIRHEEEPKHFIGCYDMFPNC